MTWRVPVSTGVAARRAVRRLLRASLPRGYGAAPQLVVPGRLRGDRDLGVALAVDDRRGLRGRSQVIDLVARELVVQPRAGPAARCTSGPCSGRPTAAAGRPAHGPARSARPRRGSESAATGTSATGTPASAPACRRRCRAPRPAWSARSAAVRPGSAGTRAGPRRCSTRRRLRRLGRLSRTRRPGRSGRLLPNRAAVRVWRERDRRSEVVVRRNREDEFRRRMPRQPSLAAASLRRGKAPRPA